MKLVFMKFILIKFELIKFAPKLVLFAFYRAVKNENYPDLLKSFTVSK